MEEMKASDAGRHRIKEKMKIAYTNIDGKISSKLELEDYLRQENPVLVCITETKLKREIEGLIFDGGRYRVLRRD